MAVDFIQSSGTNYVQPLDLPQKVTRGWPDKGEFHRAAPPEPGTVKIRWYPARPDAKPLGLWTWLSGPDKEDNVQDPFSGPGVLRRNGGLAPNTFPQAPGQHFHGPAEWYENGIPPDAIGTCVGDEDCFMFTVETEGGADIGGAAVVRYESLGGGAARTFARITDYYHYSHSWVEVQRMPVDPGVWATQQSYVWEDVPDGMTGEFNLFERNSYPNIPKDSVVEIYAQSDGTWVCDYDLDHFTATVQSNLGGGDYVLTEKYPIGVEITNPRSVTAREHNLNSTVPIGTEVLCWSQYTDRLWAYHFAYPKFMPAPPDGCGECTEVFIDVDITQEVTVGVEGVDYFVFSSDDGSVSHFRWLCFEGFWCGWWDMCACEWVPWWCTVDGCMQFVTPPMGATGPYATPDMCAIDCETVGPYWCTSGGCVQAAGAPPGTISGPYGSLPECEAACTEPNPWWCTADGCVQSETPPPGYLSGPYAMEGDCTASCTTPAESCCGPLPSPLFGSLEGQGACDCVVDLITTSPDGQEVDLDQTTLCGGGLRNFQGVANCTGDSVLNWTLDWMFSDPDTPECDGQSGTASVMTDPTHFPTCEPFSVWFEFTTAAECCSESGDPVTWRVHIRE